MIFQIKKKTLVNFNKIIPSNLFYNKDSAREEFLLLISIRARTGSLIQWRARKPDFSHMRCHLIFAVKFESGF